MFQTNFGFEHWHFYTHDCRGERYTQQKKATVATRSLGGNIESGKGRYKNDIRTWHPPEDLIVTEATVLKNGTLWKGKNNTQNAQQGINVSSKFWIWTLTLLHPWLLRGKIHNKKDHLSNIERLTQILDLSIDTVIRLIFTSSKNNHMHGSNVQVQSNPDKVASVVSTQNATL